MSDLGFESITVLRFADVLQDNGYRAKIKTGNDFLYIASGANGHPIVIYFFNETPKNVDDICLSFQLEARWTGVPSTEVSRLSKVCNDFNAEYRYIRACLIENNESYTLQIMADYPAPSGLSDERLINFFELFIFFCGELFSKSKAGEKINVPPDEIYDRHNEAVRLMHAEQPDFYKAIEYYKINSDFGFAGSLNNLGDVYENGITVRQNNLAAIYYYSRSAERGEPTAYLSLANLLSHGQPDKSILIEAAKYAILAIKGLPSGGNKLKAQKLFQEINERLEDEELDKASNLAKNWKPLFNELGKMKDSPDFHNSVELEDRLIH